MSVTKDDVRKAARLSRIAVPEERLEELAGELNGIMGWIDQLARADWARGPSVASIFSGRPRTMPVQPRSS